jgi:hypothetical protein
MSFAIAINQCLAALCQKCYHRPERKYKALDEPVFVLLARINTPAGKSANIFGHSSNHVLQCGIRDLA